MTITAGAARLRPAVVKFRAPTALAVPGPQVFPPTPVGS